jgi:hypothetical protein
VWAPITEGPEGRQQIGFGSSVVILGFINLSHPWQNVDALSLKSMLATSPCGTCIAAATSCILAETRPSFMLLRSFKISGGTQYSRELHSLATLPLATSPCLFCSGQV